MEGQKTVVLKLRSEQGEEEIQLLESLWVQFEKRAKELGISPESLFIVALTDFLDGVRHEQP